jgi:glycosyltransferase involved in cell wall biosynthesis
MGAPKFTKGGFLMSVHVSVVMPCLNERETVGICIQKAQRTLKALRIHGEVIVADNGSTDGSIEIAKSLGARVVHEKERGYGNAYRTGIEAAKGTYIVIGDSDDSYDFTDIERFIEPLRAGADFVIGTRFKGRIEKGAMPWSHRYIGNPILTWLLNSMYRTRVSDAHCGMRSFSKEAYERMNLQTTGMEFASEMVIKAAQVGLKTEEVPITLHRDGRSGRPHLRSFRDAWRHLRFMFLHSPTHLFILPGIVLFVLGLFIQFIILAGIFQSAGKTTDLHFMIFASLVTIMGFQILSTGFYARIYAATHDFVPETAGLRRLFKFFNLERGLLVGTLVFLAGAMTNIYILAIWIMNKFGTLNRLRLALFASTFVIIGVQIIFSSFFLSILGISRRPPSRKDEHHSST